MAAAGKDGRPHPPYCTIVCCVLEPAHPPIENFDSRRYILCTLERDSPREEPAMTVIEITDDQAAVLKAKAAAQGLTLKAWLGKLAGESPAAAPRKPLKPGRGMFAKYGLAPSAEEIDENR